MADFRSVLLGGLNSPFDMALVGNDLYVATTDAVLRLPYEAGDTQITVPGSKVVTLPAGPINHHWTKNLIASVDGSKLYVTVGSNSNVAERGMAVEAERAAIWEVDIRNDAHRSHLQFRFPATQGKPPAASRQSHADDQGVSRVTQSRETENHGESSVKPYK